jgi:hypothetical protein
MAPFFYQLVLRHDPDSPHAGEKVMGHCRVLAETDEEARRLLIGHVAFKGKPIIPAGASPEEADHIRKHWASWHVISLMPDPPTDVAELFAEDVPVCTWDWQTLTESHG